MSGDFPGVDIDAVHERAPRRIGMDKPCLHCGKTYRWRWSHPEKKFCSKDCASAGMRKDKVKAFWDKVQKGDGCWPWTAAKHRDGYGMVNMDTGIRKAHRLAWELTHGPIPEGLDVCHTCDNRDCCNPDHLWLGTHGENMADAKAKGRSVRGERSKQNKLTEADVREIMRVGKPGHGGGIPELAAKYGVKPGTIGAVLNRRSWKHIGILISKSGESK